MAKVSTKHLERIRQYEATNRECAAIILRNAARNGDTESLPVVWARMVLNLDPPRVKTPAAWRLVA